MRLRHWCCLLAVAVSGDGLMLKSSPARPTISVTDSSFPDHRPSAIKQTIVIRREMSAQDKLTLVGYLMGADIDEARLVTFADGRSPVLYIRMKDGKAYDEFQFPEVDHKHQSTPPFVVLRR